MELLNNSEGELEEKKVNIKKACKKTGKKKETEREKVI